MIRFFNKRNFEKCFHWGNMMKSFSRKINAAKGNINFNDEPFGLAEENKLNKILEDPSTDRNLEKMILEKIDQGKTDQEIIKEFFGSVSSGTGGRPQISKTIKNKDTITEKDYKNLEISKILDQQNKNEEKFSMLYNNSQNFIVKSDPKAHIKLKTKNLNNLKTELASSNNEKYNDYKFKERGPSKTLMDQIPFNEQVRNNINTPEIIEPKKNKQKLAKDKQWDKTLNLKNFKDIDRIDENDKKENDIDEEIEIKRKDFKSLVNEDLNSETNQINQKINKDDEKRKIAKMTNKPIIDLNNNDQDEKLKKTATLLGMLWQLTPAQKSHWYRRLKREEKEVAKKMIKIKQMEERRKLRILSKKWKIDNDGIIDINYNEDQKQENEEVKIPDYCNNFKEFTFFGDDKEYMKHYKRTCKNIEIALEELINGDTQSIEITVRQNYQIQISNVRLNKALTVVHVWWDLPLLPFGVLNKDEKLDIEDIIKKVELKLNHIIPYLRGKLTQKIGLKYAPEIRFYKDRMAEDYQDHKKSLERLSNPQQADKEFDQEFISENGAKKPLSFEQQEKINNSYDKDINSILESAETPEEKQKLEELNNLIKTKDMKSMLKEFTKALEIIEIDPENKEKFFGDLKGLQSNNLKNIKKKPIPRDPLKMNQFSPQDKTGTKMIKERNKLLKKMGMSIDDFKDEKKDKKIDVNQEILNYSSNYEYEVPSLALSERKRGIKQAFKDYSLHDKNKKNDKTIVKEFLNDSLKSKEKNHHKKKRNKSEEFWDNLDHYYDK